MKIDIEKEIVQEVKNTLSEMNIDGEVNKLLDKTRVKGKIEKEVNNVIRDKVIDFIEHSIYKAIQKQQPIIDACIYQNVEGFMYGFRTYLQNNHADTKKD